MDYKIPTRPSPMGIAVGGSREIHAPAPPPPVLSAAEIAAAAPLLVQEYSLRVPKTNVRPVSIMRFNGALGVDPSKWTSVKMAREDNSRLHKNTLQFSYPDEEMPKFGAGSEYGREAREEARKRKYGLNRKKYNPEDQPWLLKLGDKINRKYKGVREGGVSENASYFIFTQAPDGAFEVFPVQHWYNFTPIQRYKSLTSEEAEVEFGRRNKIMNYFSVMMRRRVRNDEDGEEEHVSGGSSGKKKKATSDLKVSEMEDWNDSEDEEMSDEDEDAEEKPKDKKKAAAKGKKAPPKKKKKGSDEDEGLEDSDDGDEEGRELDYISDTSESGSEGEKAVDIKGVDQEEALLNLLESGSDSDDDKKDDKEGSDEGEDEAGPSSKKEDQSESKDKKKKKKKKKKAEKKETETLSDDDQKTEDKRDDKNDTPLESSLSAKTEGGTGSSDVEMSSSSGKRKASSDLASLASGSSSKKPKMEVSSVLIQSAAAEGITEEAVRRYLLRKPMTVTELLHKFKSKKTKISSQDMVNVIAHILKKINPVKRMQNLKMYLYLTAPKS